ncbi:MAG: sugar ABC transporter permease, partial [Clostridia bacterium]|nr:sugar ABC transporter permease [Clostridia bacterium]
MAAKQREIELLKKKKLTFSEKMALTWRQIWDNKINHVLMFPFLLFFTLFTVIPVGASMVLSFTRYDVLNDPIFVGWDNYLRMFLEDGIFLIALKNTLQFAIITGPVGYILCFVFAWFINDLPPYARAFFTVVFYAPTLANVYFIFQYIFSADMYGLINSLLMNLGLLDQPIAWLTNPDYMLNIVIIVQLWCSLGTGFLSFVAGLQNLDPSLAEAGAIDGVRNRFQELFYITLPQMGGMLMFGAVMQIASAFAVGGISSAMLGNPSVDYAGHT